MNIRYRILAILTASAIILSFIAVPHYGFATETMASEMSASEKIEQREIEESENLEEGNGGIDSEQQTSEQSNTFDDKDRIMQPFEVEEKGSSEEDQSKSTKHDTTTEESAPFPDDEKDSTGKSVENDDRDQDSTLLDVEETSESEENELKDVEQGQEESDGKEDFLKESPDSSFLDRGQNLEEMGEQERFLEETKSEDSGSCGISTTWTINHEGVLTISGSGAISNYENNESPWENFKKDITEIIIEEGVTRIGEYAFNGCSAEKVIIPESISEIGENAFLYCSGIKELTMPVSAQISTENYTSFSGCSNIERINLTKGTGTQQNFSTNIYKTCLYYGYTPWAESKSSLKELVLDDGIECIGDAAFYECTALTSIPNSIKYFGNNAFYNCINLKGDLSLDNAEKIGSNCFYGCYLLNIVQIPDDINSIGDNAFYLVNNVQYSGSLQDGAFGAKAINGFVYDGLIYEDDSLKKLVGWESVAESIVLPASVECIGDYALYHCDHITELVLPDTIKAIENWALGYCEGITILDLPSSVETIGDSCFYMIGCVIYSGDLNVLSIGRPKSVNSYYEEGIIFGDSEHTNIVGVDTDVTELHIPKTVTKISYDSFSGCSNLTSVYIDSLQHWCSIDFEESPFVFADTLFVNGERITEIEIPESVTIVSKSCFENMAFLQKVVIHDDVTEIQTGAFRGCSGLKELSLPASVKMGSNSFVGCSNIEILTLTKGTGIMQDYTAKTTLYSATPWYISQNSLKELNLDDEIQYIGKGAFYSIQFFTELALPQSLTSLGSQAFYNCRNIKRIEIGASVSEIGDGCFSGCTSLEAIVVSDQNQLFCTMNNALLDIDLTKLIIYPAASTEEYFSIPETVTQIGEGAFYQARNLKTLEIPASAKIYNSNTTFGECTSLNKVILTPGTGEMADYGSSTSYSSKTTYFGNTPWIQAHMASRDCEVVLEEGIRNIGAYAFYGFFYSGPYQFVIPDSVTSIGDYAFYNCSGFTELTMPVSAVIANSPNTFYGCTNLTSIHFSKGNGDMPDYVSYSTGDDLCILYTPWYLSKKTLGEIYFEEGILSIGDDAFNGSKVSFVKLPDTLKEIGKWSFYGCTSLSTVSFPKTLEKIGEYAFYGGKTMEQVVFLGTKEEWKNIQIETKNNRITDVNVLCSDGILCYEHSWNEGSLAKPSTCTEEGIFVRTCTVCGDELEEYIPKAGHTEEELLSVSATCTEPGLTAGSKCLVCGEILVSQESIPPLGHKPIVDPAKPPTYDESGLTEGSHCSVCGEVLTAQQVIPKLIHFEIQEIKPVSFNKLKLFWDSYEGAHGYIVFRKAEGGSFEVTKSISDPTICELTNTVTSGIKYTYYIAAYSMTGSTKEVLGKTQEMSAIPLPATPAIQSASMAAFNKIKIIWTKVSGCAGYVIYRSTEEDGQYSVLKTVTMATATEYSNIVQDGQTYYYKIRAFVEINGKKVYGEYSEVLSGDVIDAPPANFRLEQRTATKIIFNWDQVEDCEGYVIYRYFEDTGKCKAIKNITSNDTLTYSYKVEADTEYKFTMRAFRVVNGKKVYSDYTDTINN